MDDAISFGPEGRRHRQFRKESIDCPAQNRLRRLAFELCAGIIDLSLAEMLFRHFVVSITSLRSRGMHMSTIALLYPVVPYLKVLCAKFNG